MMRGEGNTNTYVNPQGQWQGFANERAQGGKVAFAVEWNIGHAAELGFGYDLALVFMNEVLNRRYPKPQVGGALASIPLANGWWSDASWMNTYASNGDVNAVTTYPTIEADGAFSGNKTTASWLPSQSAAQAYVGAACLMRPTTGYANYGDRATPLVFDAPLLQGPGPMLVRKTGDAQTLQVDPTTFGANSPISLVECFVGSTLVGQATTAQSTANGARYVFSLTLPSTVGVTGVSVRATRADAKQMGAEGTVITLPSSIIIAPVITSQPVSQSAQLNTNVAFSVQVTGTSPSFQWRKNGIDIKGANASSYMLPAATSADNGALFSVVVSNDAGIVTSANARLTVIGAVAVSRAESASVTDKRSADGLALRIVDTRTNSPMKLTSCMPSRLYEINGRQMRTIR